MDGRLQRARGRAEVAVSLREGAVRLDRLYQEGCGKAILPGPRARAGAVPEVVFVNTSGGVTGGDRIAWGLEAGAGAALVATSQAAERVYRSAGGAARIETRSLPPLGVLDGAEPLRHKANIPMRQHHVMRHVRVVNQQPDLECCELSHRPRHADHPGAGRHL